MGTVKCHGTTTSLQGVQPDWPYAATRLTVHRFRSCQLRQCNNWSLVHLVTAVHMLTWLYIYIYMHVCVSIYKKGVDYLCSYITHLKKKFILGSHIITITYLNVSKSRHMFAYRLNLFLTFTKRNIRIATVVLHFGSDTCEINNKMCSENVRCQALIFCIAT